ncbi:MAG: tRNA (adenosine(37)-N6)-dimethylallyltransferase MiaA, partial [bacterium]
MKKKFKHTLIVIVGPTAVGKTSMAIQLAKSFKTEIISADSRQFYKELEIGTSKPSIQELKEVPHHLINSHSFTELVDAGTFERLALEKVKEISKNHEVVIVVGGSGLYIQSLCEGLDPVDVRDEELRAELTLKSLAELQVQLQLLDPEYFAEVDIQNPQRLMRALEIIITTGKKYSEQRTGQKKEREFNIIKIGLTDDREILYDRINKRVDSMVQNGLEEEARKFESRKTYYTLQTVGYSEWFDYFEGKISREEAIELIKRNTRRYAKRQLTWFRRDQEIKWFNANELDLIHQYI